MVASEDGLDEISICAATNVIEVDGEELRRYRLTPGEVGVQAASEDAFALACAGGTPEENAAAARAVLGEDRADAREHADDYGRLRVELAAINAGAAIYAGGQADTIAAGVRAARAAIDDGSAAAALQRFVRATHAHAPAEASR